MSEEDVKMALGGVGDLHGDESEKVAADGAPAAEEKKDEEMVPPEVNDELKAQLEDMGFSKNRVIRALYFSGNSTLEGALNWLEEHGVDADIEDELLVPKSENVPGTGKKKLTKEELEERIKRARAIREQQEKAAEKNREKMRIEMGKQMQEARRIEEEQARKRLAMEREMERKEKERAMAKVKAQLEADRRERRRKLGLPEELTEEERAREEAKEREKAEADAKRFGGYIKPVTALANMRDCLVAIKKDNEQAAPVAFKTLSVYVRNLGEHPEEEKFRRINMSNAAFQSRVGCLEQGLAFLRHMGFREMDGYLVIEKERATPELVNETAKLLHDAMTNPFFGAL